MSQLRGAIEGQPAALEALSNLDVEVPAAQLSTAERCFLVGTGTSQHAAELGALFLRRSGREAYAFGGSAFLASPPRLSARDAAIVISHTGETAYARSARRLIGRSKATLIAITGEGSGWDEAIEVAARESSETYTASYLAALYAIGLLASALDGAPFGRGALTEVPGRVSDALGASALEIKGSERLIVLTGAGCSAVTAREGALKLREAARLVTQGFDAEFLLHGSAVPLGEDDRLVLVDPGGDPSGLTRALGDAAAAEGVAVSRVEPLIRSDPYLDQFELTVRVQLAAARLAEARGYDPDAVIRGAWEDEVLWGAGGEDRS